MVFCYSSLNRPREKLRYLEKSVVTAGVGAPALGDAVESLGDPVGSSDWWQLGWVPSPIHKGG